MSASSVASGDVLVVFVAILASLSEFSGDDVGLGFGVGGSWRFRVEGPRKIMVSRDVVLIGTLVTRRSCRGGLGMVLRWCFGSARLSTGDARWAAVAALGRRATGGQRPAIRAWPENREGAVL